MWFCVPVLPSCRICLYRVHRILLSFWCLQGMWWYSVSFWIWIIWIFCLSLSLFAGSLSVSFIFSKNQLTLVDISRFFYFQYNWFLIFLSFAYFWFILLFFSKFLRGGEALIWDFSSFLMYDLGGMNFHLSITSYDPQILVCCIFIVL